MTRWIVGVVVTALLAIGAIIVAAAGSGSDSDAASEVSAGPDADAMAEFRECLSEQGVEAPAPPSGGEMPAPGGEPPTEGEMPQQLPAPSEGTQEAMEACSDLLPEGAGVFTAPGGPPGTAPTPQN